MYRYAHPTPDEIDAYIHRAHALRSDAVCGFFRRLIRTLFQRHVTRTRFQRHEAPAPAKWA